jgi:hypothetical protein
MGQFLIEVPWPGFTAGIVEVKCAFRCKEMLEGFELACRTSDRTVVGLGSGPVSFLSGFR